MVKGSFIGCLDFKKKTDRKIFKTKKLNIFLKIRKEVENFVLTVQTSKGEETSLENSLLEKESLEDDETLKFTKILKRKLRRKIKVLFTRRRLGDCAKLICNINKAKKYLNWRPYNSKIEKIIIDEISWSKYLIKQAFRRFPN